MKAIILRFSLLVFTASFGLGGKLHAQCPASGPTVYSLLPLFGGPGNTLQSINPATGAATHVNGAGTDLLTTSTAIAWDPVNGKIWYCNDAAGANGIRIYSYDLATNTNTPSTVAAGYQFFQSNGTTVTNPGATNKAAYNPVDGMIYFHQASQGLFRFNPANPIAGAISLGLLSVDGTTDNGTITSGGDIAFDGLGNMTGAFNNANKLVTFRAQYDANGNYLGINLSGQSFANSSAAPAGIAFLANGDYIVGSPGSSGTINTNTGVFTAYSPSNVNTTNDYASCAAPAPNISSVQKTATRNCAARTITYTITVQNTGTTHAYDVLLKDATPAGLTLTSVIINGVTIINPAPALNGSGLPLRTPGSTADGVLMKGTTATVVLNYTYTAAGDGATFTNQGFVTYAGVQKLNLPNDQIPTDDPATATAGDATAITQCTANPPVSCPGEIYTVGASTANSFKELYVLDASTRGVVRTYPLPYDNTNGNITYSIAVPGDGFAYTVSATGATPGTTASRTIYKTDLSAAPGAAATVSTGIVLPVINGPNGSYYISGTADKLGNIYFSSDKGNALIQVTPAGVVNTIWNGANPVTLAATPAPPAGATFTGGFKDITIDANGDYYFIEDFTLRVWQVPKGTTTAIYRGTVTGLGTGNSANVACDIVFINGEVYVVTSGTALAATSGPSAFWKVNMATMVGTQVPRPAGDNQVFADAASPVCSLISLAPLSGKVLNDNNGQAGGVNGTPVAGATVTLYAADGVTVIATTTTDADGNYQFNTISPSTTYIVAVTPPGGFSNVSSHNGVTPTDGRTTVSVPASGTMSASIDFGVNQPPAVVNDTLLNLAPGTIATVPNILTNDTDANGGILSPDSISLVFPAGATNPVVDAQGDTIGFTVPGQGTWALNSNGSVSFTPQAGFAGDPAPINYTITDAAGLKSNIGTIVIDYDYPPVAVNDTASTPMNTPLNSTVTTNDTCRDGPCNYTPLSSDPPVNGTVTLNPDGTYTYTPNTGFTGTDTFSYVICNSGVPVRCDTASVFITVLSVLPADLLSFRADIGAPCDVQLSWTTGVETNLHAFEIESGIDGAVFRKAGSVAAHGFGSSYTYRYSQGAEGRNYFRLKMIDLNGSYAYSRVAMIDLSCTGTRDIRVHPAVVKGQLTIDGLQRGESVSVYDMNGRRALLAKADGPQAVLDLSPLSQGSYVVVVVTLTGEPVHYKIMKQ